MKSLGITLLLLILGFIVWEKGYRFNLTPSMPRGIYQISHGNIERGDIVGMCLGGEFAHMAKEQGYLQAGICPSGTQPLLKQVVALEGDKVHIDAKAVHITQQNHSLSCAWPLPQKADSRGYKLPSELTSGIIPKGQALLMTKQGGSFDGRYFGTVSLNTITKIIKIYTEEE